MPCDLGGSIAAIVQPFPNHFHEHYVIGFVEDGQRALSCKNKEYSIECGKVILFNPGDNHACVQSDDGTFDYRGFNISKSIMLDLAEEVTGRRKLPGFSKNVTYDDEITCYIYMVPVITVITSVLILHEKLTLLQLVVTADIF